MHIRKKMVAGMVVMLVCALFASLAFSGSEASRDSEGGNSSMQEVMKKLEIFDFREKKLLEKLSNLENDIKSKKEEIKKVERSLGYLGKRSRNLMRTLRKLETERKTLEERLARRFVYLYKYARRGYMRALCTAKDLDEFRRRAGYLSRLMAEDSRQLASIFSQEYDLAKRLEGIKEEINRTDALRKQGRADLAALREDVEKEVIQLMRIHEEKEFYSTAVRELQSVDPQIKETIVKVEDRTPSTPLELRNISELKGRLPVPLLGTIVRGRKLFKSKRVQLEKGIFIRSEEGAKVRAILPGKVEFSGQLKGYGQVIIINHGSRFFTISALLSNRDKREGDLVQKGEVIGEVGGAISGIGPSLYFEIRKGGRNVDPLKWLKVKG
ncbi:MAG: peptidoglycan DD-metalloendopeptidase family protein [Deltaproteobacteria bacterium]|nr:peptidoglycan DD-metalloendopeptidase family protein [Deltaproteobacteria bacterium]